MLGRRTRHTTRRDADPFLGRGKMVSLLLLFFLTGFSCSTTSFNFKYPALISAWEGSCAFMNCEYSIRSNPKMENLTWYKDPQYDDVNKKWIGSMYYHSGEKQTSNSSFLKRVTFLGDLKKNKNCTLLIQDLRVNDSGLYGVRLESVDNRWMSQNPFLPLNITDSPPKPQIVIPEMVTESTHTRVTCSIDYYCPEYPIQLLWDGPVKGHSNHTEVQVDTRILKTTNTLTFTPSWEDDKKRLTCRLTSQKGAGKSSEREITLDVKHKPKNVHIDLEGSAQTIEEGASLSLRCLEGSSNPPVSEYQWYKDSYSPAQQNGSALHIIHATAEDAGNYSCEAKNSIGTAKSQRLEIVVHFSPKEAKVERSSKGKIIEGNDVTLTCSAQCYPPATSYDWYKDDHLLKQSEKDLKFLNVRADDSGKYHCIVYNPMGNISSLPDDLNVLYAPKNVTTSIRYPDPLWIKEGEKVQLVCSYNSSNPEAFQFTWYQDSKKRPTQTREKTIQRITLADSGEYYCEATNDAGTSPSPVIKLDVKYAPKDVKVQLDPQKQLEGDRALLKCAAGMSNPSVTRYNWYKDGKKYDASRDSINFQALKSSDSGHYICEAVNAVSGTKSQNVQLLDVQYAPRNVNVSMDPSMWIVENSDVTLTCESDSNPEVYDFKWYKENQLLVEEHGKTLQLWKIKRIEAGQYQCEVRNTISSTRSVTIHLDVLYSATTIGKISALAIGLLLLLSLVVILALRCTVWEKLSGLPLSTSGEIDDRSDTFFVLNKKQSRDDQYDMLGNIAISSQAEGEESLSYASLRFPLHVGEDAGVTRATVNSRSSVVLQRQEEAVIYSVPHKLRKVPQTMHETSLDYENIPAPTTAKTDDEKEEEISYSTIINLKHNPLKKLEWESESDSDDGGAQYAELKK